MEISESWNDWRLVSVERFSRPDSRGYFQRKEVRERIEKMIAKRLEENGGGRANGIMPWKSDNENISEF